MDSDDKIKRIVFDAIEEVNAYLPKDKHIKKSLDTVLYGWEGELDSLSLMNLIVATEQLVEKEFGVTVNLIEENTMTQEDSPLRTAGTLSDYIKNLLQTRSNGQPTKSKRPTDF